MQRSAEMEGGRVPYEATAIIEEFVDGPIGNDEMIRHIRERFVRNG